MAPTFVQTSREYLKKIDEEVARLQSLRSQVETAIQTDEVLSGAAASPVVANKTRGKRSAATRKRMAEAQQARYRKNTVAKKAAKKASAKSAGAKSAGAKKTAKKILGPRGLSKKASAPVEPELRRKRAYKKRAVKSAVVDVVAGS